MTVLLHLNSCACTIYSHTSYLQTRITSKVFCVTSLVTKSPSPPWNHAVDITPLHTYLHRPTSLSPPFLSAWDKSCVCFYSLIRFKVYVSSCYYSACIQKSYLYDFIEQWKVEWYCNYFHAILHWTHVQQSQFTSVPVLLFMNIKCNTFFS